MPKEPEEGPHLRLPVDDDGFITREVTTRTLAETIMGLSQEDAVNHPKHYTTHPSGIECIDVVEHMNFNLGNAVKYIWRVDQKDDPGENLRKALWYIRRELKRRGIKE